MANPTLDASMPSAVQETFDGYAPAARETLLALRGLILETAAGLEGVGPLEETLKWGEPAYLTSASRSGTTIRLGWKPKRPDEVFLFVHCQTSLADQWRTWFPQLTIEGTRALVLPVGEPLEAPVLRTCIEAALTYHRHR